MNKQALTRGALAGMAGGVVMAMWSMIVLLLTGSGFWTPLNLIAHTLWRSAPLDARFSIGGLVIGLVVHMMMSMVLGMVLAAVVGAVKPLGGDQVRRAATGMVFGIVVWLVMQYAVWKAVDPAAAPLFTPWVFALGHLMYGAVAGLGLVRTPAERHAAV
ncbi:hypothetical protein ATK30_4935 [Amycolatopsis echigonensis]|uniref:Uncharacterized protein n=2 Tax=Pseudonocardiaceae TaxID=2070 RepID=A0A2N3WJP1_9PSEU|nr:MULTISPECIES: DUF6789 family protein [Pseudonocardiaceae]AEA23552.1 conserved hypothetical membrane spanning protein [Pseudonocardia dioxanivorans CB1190]PKV94066.1 hypothetical protein ATK30_4935 [Amycolatopsis niigatensis]